MLNISKIIKDNLIKVYFQVIISPIDTLSFSVESFIRGIDPDTDELISPYLLFKEANEQDLTSALEKVCIRKSIRK